MQQPDTPPDRALFELGATSLTMVALQRRLSLHFGRAVPLQDMFEDPTIRGIARSLADGRVRTHALVAFAAPADDGRPRLFMMPGILSLPFHLRDMATAVASEVVLVSAPLPGLLGDERPISTVAAQAAFFLGEIPHAQPPRPPLRKTDGKERSGPSRLLSVV